LTDVIPAIRVVTPFADSGHRQAISPRFLQLDTWVDEPAHA
jgi:hypothetical protein